MSPGAAFEQLEGDSEKANNCTNTEKKFWSERIAWATSLKTGANEEKQTESQSKYDRHD